MDRIIRLEPWEALLISERVPNDACHFESNEPIGRNFLLKVFSAMDEMTTDSSVNKEGFVDISISEDELWLVKTCISVFDKVDGAQVGLKLRRKVHILLLSINSDPGLPFGDTAEEPVYNMPEPEPEEEIVEEAATEEESNDESDKDDTPDSTEDGTREETDPRLDLPEPEGQSTQAD
ncbi:MAG: hypothetical protein IH937_11045 [Acidobacteria bacterium]|nr:hypothetical protein [Acidobacteriota bacterium]